MPLVSYFVFVGSALLLLLIGLDWSLPEPAPEPTSSVIERPTIRIASVEHLPERVVIDTSLPTIMPPMSIFESAERRPQETVADAKPVVTSAIPAPANDVPKKQNPAKREPPKKVAVRRAAPKVNIEMASNDKVPATPAKTGLSLLDNLKDGLAKTQAKLMAGLEPLTAFVSKSRPEIR
jgi:hypothetical protein